MGIRYDALLNGLKEVEHDNHIIIDRKSDKVQEVSLKRFLLFSNVLVAANIKLKQAKEGFLTKADPDYKSKKAEARSRLEGEKKLAQLRKFNVIYSNWQKSIKNNTIPNDVKALKKEKKKLDTVINKLSHFKETLGKDKIDLHLFEDVTDVDRQQFQELNDSLNALKDRQEVISSHISIQQKKALTPDQAQKVLRLQNKADSILKDEASNTLKVKLYNDLGLLKEMKAALKKDLDQLIANENHNQIDEIVDKIKKYEDLHNSVDEQVTRLVKKGKRDSAFAIGEKAFKEVANFLSDRSLLNLNQLVDVRAKIEVYNREAEKLSPLDKRHNEEALDVLKSLIFLKSIEKKLLSEEIKIREEERKNAHNEIERNEPKVSIPFPNLEGLEEDLSNANNEEEKSLIQAKIEARLEAHNQKIQDYDQRRDALLNPAKDHADRAIEADFDYTYFESKILDLSHFPYVIAYDNYQQGKPVEAGKEIWKFLEMANKGKLPSKKDFDDAAKDIFGERLDSQIYNGLVNDFHKTKGDAQGDLIWFKWVNESKAIPTYEEFKDAFVEKVGIEPLRENYDRLMRDFESSKPQNADNVWIYLNSKNERIPTWNEFKSLFKDSTGIEPERSLYEAKVDTGTYAELVWNKLYDKNAKELMLPTWNEFKKDFREGFGIEPERNLYNNIVNKEINEFLEKRANVLDDLKILAGFVRAEEKWFAQDKNAVREKLAKVDKEIEIVNLKLQTRADQAKGNSDEDIVRLKKELEQLAIEREGVQKFLNNKERIQLRKEAVQLNFKIDSLRKLLKES